MKSLIFLDDQKVYPEVSAEGPEADWFADEAFKARGLERLTDDQKFIKAVGKARGCEVEFKNLDRWVTDENGKRKRVSPNGRFDKNTGKIYINTSTYTKHDALQFMEMM